MPDPQPQPWHLRAKKWFLRHWRTGNPRHALIRDIIVAAGIVALLLGVIWGYTGQPFPTQAPVVSVESGSMMHGHCLQGSPPAGDCTTPRWKDAGFGRVGTIDPGDIVFVKRVKGAQGIEDGFGGGSRDGYGAHGDVVVYRPFGNRGATAIIHRALLYIEATNSNDPSKDSCTPKVDCVFKIRAACNGNLAKYARESAAQLEKYCTGTTELITLHLTRGGLFLNMQDYPAVTPSCPTFSSGFITKGDNNGNYDQQSGQELSCAVRMDWVVGKARGEVPWFGLIKLALYGNCAGSGRGNYDGSNDPTQRSNWHILAACAPYDIWVCLFLSIGALVAIPILIDFVGHRMRAQRGKVRPPPTGRKL